ncbi:hypothetical protein EV140_1943 [Microcella alkaliphila]|uniref:Uncharacterized protein n=1 Tax=Microcella alkaliphila TaxID=279828 RepID=A0A4Q7TIL6_9MICO|nr:hypothetical protein [Microcella alkaliphila]RZT59338.1 hypothetical protein EV140_1943 [Microcella alkaliphila]
MPTTQTFTETLVVLHCWKCRCAFGITRDHYDRAQASSDVNFYCPNGHSAVFKQTREQELETQLAREKRLRGYTESSLTHTRDQLQATERSLRGHKAAKTRIKNRIAAGVCPCCNRTFQNLARHMAGQHPHFSSTEETP